MNIERVSTARAFTQPARFRRLSQQPFHFGDQRIYIGVDETRHIVFDDAHQFGRCKPHHRHADGHRFEHRQPQTGPAHGVKEKTVA